MKKLRKSRHEDRRGEAFSIEMVSGYLSTTSRLTITIKTMLSANNKKLMTTEREIV